MLPSSEEAFALGHKEHTSTLVTALAEQHHEYSSFAGRVLVACLFHRTLQQTLRSLRQEHHDADSQSSPYWVEHRNLDNSLVIMMMFLPHNLKLPQSFRCQNAIFVNITIHAATICLQRAAAWKAQQLMLPETSILQHQTRLLPAAQEIANIIRFNSDLEVALQNPILLFSVYLAALVFLDDAITEHAHESKTHLDLLLHIMLRLGESNEVASSMAIQLAAETEQGGIYSSAIEKV